MDWENTTARQDEKHLGIWCALYKSFDGYVVQWYASNDTRETDKQMQRQSDNADHTYTHRPYVAMGKKIIAMKALHSIH